MSIYETLSVRPRILPVGDQDLYCDVYSPNDAENISKLGKIFNFFRDPDEITLDLTQELPDVTGIPFPELGDYFGLSINLNNIDMNTGLCIIKNRVVFIEEELNLNMDSSGSWLTDDPPPPHAISSTVYYYIVARFDFDLEAESEADYDSLISVGFVKAEDFDDIRDECCILWVLEVETDGSGNVSSVDALQENPESGYESDYVEIIDGSHIFWSVIDGGPITG